MGKRPRARCYPQARTPFAKKRLLMALLPHLTQAWLLPRQHHHSKHFRCTAKHAYQPYRQKIDAETNTPYPLGSATLKGALFRVSYFDQGEQEPRAWGIQDRSSVNPSSQKTTKQSMDYLGTPKRTWVFKTDETGGFAFDENISLRGMSFTTTPTTL